MLERIHGKWRAFGNFHDACASQHAALHGGQSARLVQRAPLRRRPACVRQERDEARKALESASVVAVAAEAANGKRPAEDGEEGPAKRVRPKINPKRLGTPPVDSS